MKNIMVTVFIFLAGIQVFSQSDTSQVYPPKVDNRVKFKLSGYSNFDFSVPEAGIGGFSSATFAPIFTWRQSDKLFFQAEIEFVSDKDAFDGGFAMEFMTLNYLINKYMTFYSGKFLGPLGTFQARYHPAWINKSVNRPIGFGTRINGLKRLQAGSQVGAGIKGVSQIGTAKLNYDVYIANGDVLDSSTGELETESLADNNQNKAIGARVGLLPLLNSSLEIGVSGYTAKVGDKGSSYENTSVTLLALDLNYVKSTAIGVFDVKGEFQQRTLDEGTMYYVDAFDTVGFTYKNNPSVLYGQLAYRLPVIGSKEWTSRLEFVGRFSKMTVDDNSTYGANLSDVTLGLNYWVNFNTVIKMGYNLPSYANPSNNSNMLMIQASMGF